MCIDYFKTATVRLELTVPKAPNTHKKALVNENVHLQKLRPVVQSRPYPRVLNKGWLGIGRSRSYHKI